MTGELTGRVAFISGGARGMGRAHALALAAAGADIITFDLCEQIDSCGYPLATAADLAETVALVERLDRRIVAYPADVRDEDAVRAVLDEGLAELGRLDVLVANAGIAPFFGPAADTARAWSGLQGKVRSLDVANRGYLGYHAAEHGVVGLMRIWANALGEHHIRVNTVHPTGTNTPRGGP